MILHVNTINSDCNGNLSLILRTISVDLRASVRELEITNDYNMETFPFVAMGKN